MAITHKLISSQTLGSSTASVTFSSIPQIYTDLLLKMSVRSTAFGTSWDDLRLRFNSYTSQYGGRLLYATGGSVTGQSESNSYWVLRCNTQDSTGSNSDIYGNYEFYIGDYASASRNKSAIGQGVTIWPSSSGGSIIEANGSYWGGTPAAITSIEFTMLSGGSIRFNSTFSLYGILKA